MLKNSSHPVPKHRVTMMYFSPTGTTEKILINIASGMGEDDPVKVNVTLPSCRKELEHLAAQAQGTDYWLIGSPVHFGKIPSLMQKQLVRLNGQHKPVIAVVVYGNRDYGIALNQLVKILTAQDFRVVGAAAFIAEHSYSQMFPIALGRPDQKDLELARAFGKNLMAKGLDTSSISADQIGGEVELIVKLNRDDHPRPTVVLEKCDDCLVCVDSCPLGLIAPETKVHRDEKAKQLCLGCMSCVKSCPNNARIFHVSAFDRFFMNKVVFKKALHYRHEPFLLF